MTASLDKETLARITGGEIVKSSGRIVFSGVEYSSAEISGGELFVCLKGEKTHGHKFLKDAYDRGAALFLIEDASLAAQFPEPERLVVVRDTHKALHELALFWRKEAGQRVLAITGSVGKTTCKEITAAILLKTGAGTYSIKSHNNHVGVPYTMLRMKRGEPWTVLEMGMNHAGEISTLSKLAQPDIAAITRVAPAHIEAFGSLEAIARAKLEILDGLKESQPVILNGDDECLVKEFRSREARHKAWWFGTREGCDCQLMDVKSLGLDGISFSLLLDGEKISVRMGALGRQTAMNAACAALCARRLIPDLTTEQLKRGLESFRAPLMRLNLKHLTSGRMLIDDSYNANPASMAAFLEFAYDLSAGGTKKVGLIIGDMLELGSESPGYHLEIGEKAARAHPAFVVAVGAQKSNLLKASAENGIKTFAAQSPEEAADIVVLEQFDIVMVKASRGIGLDRAAASILEKCQAPVP